MPQRFVFLLLTLPLLGGCSSLAAVKPRVQQVPGTGVYVWSQPGGWVQPDRGDWGQADHVRAESVRAFQSGAHADALAGFLVLERQLSRPTPRGQPGDGAGGDRPRDKDLNFHIAECYFHLGNYDKALNYYRKAYRQDFPAQNLLDQALKRVFEIGMAYLKGEARCHFVGFSYDCEEHGIEILVDPSNGLITEYPMLSFADDAWVEVAKYYFEEGEYPEAVPIYDRVASDPESEWADMAEYHGALSIYMQVRGVDYDQRIIQDAERRFRRYLVNHRRGEHAEAAREKVREISEMEGAKNLRIAKFYLRESQPEACALYLQAVLTRYPESVAAQEARDIQKYLDRIKGGT